MTPLTTAMRARGILNHGLFEPRSVEERSYADLINLIEELTEATDSASSGRAVSVFEFSASSTMFGSREVCANLDCRRDRLRNLMEYAVALADRVIVANPLMEYLVHPPQDAGFFRHMLADDLALLVDAAPAIDAGLIEVVTPPVLCSDCLLIGMAGDKDNRNLRRGLRRLANRYVEEGDHFAWKSHEGYHIDVEGVDEFFEHGSRSRRSTELPAAIAKRPSIAKRIDAGDRVQLSKTLMREMRDSHEVAQAISANVAFQLLNRSYYSTRFLTDRQIHVSSIADFVGGDQDEYARVNEIASRNLVAALPFIRDVPTRDLITLWRREKDAQIRFRDALLTAMTEVSNGNVDSEDYARQLYSDVIQPSLAEMDARVKTAKRDLAVGSAVWGTVTAAAVSFGMMSGAVSAELVAAAAALGAGNWVRDAAKATGWRTDVSGPIRDHDFYFLWRARELMA